MSVCRDMFGLRCDGLSSPAVVDLSSSFAVRDLSSSLFSDRLRPAIVDVGMFELGVELGGEGTFWLGGEYWVAASTILDLGRVDDEEGL